MTRSFHKPSCTLDPGHDGECGVADAHPSEERRPGHYLKVDLAAGPAAMVSLEDEACPRCGGSGFDPEDSHPEPPHGAPYPDECRACVARRHERQDL